VQQVWQMLRWPILGLTLVVLAMAFSGYASPWAALGLWVAAGLATLAVALSQRLPAGEAATQPLDLAPPPSVSPPAGSELRLAASLLEAFPEPVILLGGDLHVLVLNRAAAASFPSLQVGLPVAFGLRIPEVLEAIRDARASGRSPLVEFAERVPVDRWYEALICPVPEVGAHGRVLIVARDVSRQRQIERMRADFVANASHELRTPLASLLGFIETLQGPARNDTAARERFLGIMRVQANRMARLIDDLLSLSRIELNAHVKPRDAVEIATIVGHVVDTLQPLAAERKVEVTLARGPSGLSVAGDRDELIRLFENLVENALKYGAAGEAVRIEIAAGRDQARGRDVVRVAVADRGPGIAPEHLPRLTERFYRVDVSHSREQGGTGLGLAIVKHILNRHDGELAIESTVGRGSTFTVELPRLAGPPT
jgi:two-component system phosphate regulon sensor histidine kinase PhoR